MPMRPLPTLLALTAAAAFGGLAATGLKLADIQIDRKMLSELAINDPAGFAKICDAAKNA